MQYVYILQSLKFPEKFYIGCTHNVAERLKRHNAGQSDSGSRHTELYGPWKIVNTFGFENTDKAFAFEKYLKSGSGRAFCKKHF
ncbi:GIY-YIG nuclease family protein [Thalassospira lucentensis]|uniref:GIY-YIG nuclease family protein n=1 Tax=Thalassospira lucentensis TaxID=168935 RepID=UPI0003B56D3D|nr:GIY-YIG nuclease family protein [Thalassospira lucentensis]RCK23776.1 excinuclease ABC subunit C [Thalassospira lucentensis MCCC 1A00383 = DSM 14000]